MSLRITGRDLDRLRARAGQFFLWRFLTAALWGTAHPFSLSAAPDGRSLRITVKGLGDHTARIAQIPPGTRVVAEGPFGVFTDERAPPRQGAADRRRHRDHADPRAARDDGAATSSSLYRVVADEDVIFRDELDELAAAQTASSCTTSSATTTARAATCSRRRTCASSCPTSPSATSSSAGRRR